MSKNRDGKPTAFQVAAIKKAGLTLKGIKTYRDAENALKRVKRAEKANGVDFIKKAAKVKVTVDPKRKPVGCFQATQRGSARTVSEKTVKQVAGVGVFRVKIAKSDILQALLISFAKTILDVLEVK